MAKTDNKGLLGRLALGDRRAQDDVQKLTDKSVAQVDKQFAQKEIELMAI